MPVAIVASLVHSILKRPYVFGLLAAFLFISVRSRGWKKTLAFVCSGYGIAWASEALSIRTGFPYGLYHYNAQALAGELGVAGVPLFDSLSYTFMVYAAYTVAQRCTPSPFPLPPGEGEENILPPPTMGDGPSNFPPPLRGGGRGRVVFLTALLTTILDMIVDPLAVRGEEWFLGPIFHYAEPGFYFGVPLSNFIGWFGVAALIACCYRWIDRTTPDVTRLWREGLFLYVIIALFNIGITVTIGQWGLAAASLGWFGGASFFVWRSQKQQRRFSRSR